MKTITTIEERNAIVEKNLSMIDMVMTKHRDVIKAGHMERDDVYQQLAERLINAVDAYDPAKGELEVYLEIQLERELFNCAHPRRLYGQMDTPTAFRKNRAVPLDVLNETVIEQEKLLAA